MKHLYTEQKKVKDKDVCKLEINNVKLFRKIIGRQQEISAIFNKDQICPRSVMDSVITFEVIGEGSSPSGGTKIMKKLFILIFSVLIPLQGLANDRPTGLVPCGTENYPCGFCDIFKLVHNIINYLLVPCSFNNNIPIIPTIAALAIVIGGFYLLFAGTSPESYAKGKSILTAVVIGLVIVFLSWAFLNTFLTHIGVAEWTGLQNWWEIRCP